MRDKLETLHQILLWTPHLTQSHDNVAAHNLMMRIGEYCLSSDQACEKFGWLLRRITLTQAFEASKTMRLAREQPHPDWMPHYISLSIALHAWELVHVRRVHLFWDDTAFLDSLEGMEGWDRKQLPLPDFDDED